MSVAPGRPAELTHGDCSEQTHLPTYTIEGLFDLVHAAVEGEQVASFVTARFHAELGYPQWVYVDWEANVADEEVGASVVGFRRGS